MRGWGFWLGSRPLRDDGDGITKVVSYLLFGGEAVFCYDEVVFCYGTASQDRLHHLGSDRKGKGQHVIDDPKSMA